MLINAPIIADTSPFVAVAFKTTPTTPEFSAILIEKNPSMLAASFTLPEGTAADVSTRVKMGQTSNVFALVKAGGSFYMTTKEIKVTLGGCGG